MRGPWPETLQAVERVHLARTKVSLLIDQITGLLALHEANRIIVYSDRLSAQVPKSYAAHAFNVFQRSSHSYELVRLCALWDRSDQNRESIPTVVALIDHPDVIAALAADIASAWPEEPQWAKEQVQKLTSGLCRAVAVTKAINRSARLRNLVNHRDKNLAHALSESRAESRGVAFSQPKYGDEAKLLRASIMVADRLYLGIANTSFDFDATRTFARKNAEALWHSCRFDIDG